MPQIILNDVVLAFTQNMTRESQFGGHNYSFIINKDIFCDAVRKALAVQKTQIWPESKNTNEFILKKCNAKSKDDVTHEETQKAMSDDDVLIQVKSKEGPIENSKKVPLGRGTTADILIDVFEFEYGKKQFICVRSHASRGCTVKVKELREYSNGPKYFDFDADADEGINTNAVEDTLSEVVPF